MLSEEPYLGVEIIDGRTPEPTVEGRSGTVADSVICQGHHAPPGAGAAENAAEAGDPKGGRKLF